jgi:beta-glucosidase
MAAGPVGIRSRTVKATEYPASVALAASWDTSLAEAFGIACARDARARGIHIILGGGMNIQRVPQDSRNFDYYSEDPYLAGRIGVAMVRGTQSQGVAATIKHFAANNQETNRMRIDIRVSEPVMKSPNFTSRLRRPGSPGRPRAETLRPRLAGARRKQIRPT